MEQGLTYLQVSPVNAARGQRLKETPASASPAGTPLRTRVGYSPASTRHEGRRRGPPPPCRGRGSARLRRSASWSHLQAAGTAPPGGSGCARRGRPHQGPARTSAAVAGPGRWEQGSSLGGVAGVEPSAVRVGALRDVNLIGYRLGGLGSPAVRDGRVPAGPGRWWWIPNSGWGWASRSPSAGEPCGWWGWPRGSATTLGSRPCSFPLPKPRPSPSAANPWR